MSGVLLPVAQLRALSLSYILLESWLQPEPWGCVRRESGPGRPRAASQRERRSNLPTMPLMCLYRCHMGQALSRAVRALAKGHLSSLYSIPSLTHSFYSSLSLNITFTAQETQFGLSTVTGWKIDSEMECIELMGASSREFIFKLYFKSNNDYWL